MTDIRHLVQDLRAEAHRAPADVADLMRRAAALLDHADTFGRLPELIDADPQPAPIGPPDKEEPR